MRLVSWNVNGLRAVVNKGVFYEAFNELDADVFALQETKLQQDQISLELPGYDQYWNFAQKKGYSGTAVFTRHPVIDVAYGLDVPSLDEEGRLITIDFDKFYFVCCYTPNAQDGLRRIEFRMEWEDALREHLVSLDKTKPVVYCGDLNVAHNEIDLKNPTANIGNPGFSYEERDKMTRLLSSGFTDSFRFMYPDKTDAYSWWSYRMKARERNVGWRIDYFIVSERLCDRIISADIYDSITGSDHCPVGLDLNI